MTMATQYRMSHSLHASFEARLRALSLTSRNRRHWVQNPGTYRARCIATQGPTVGEEEQTEPEYPVSNSFDRNALQDLPRKSDVQKPPSPRAARSTTLPLTKTQVRRWLYHNGVEAQLVNPIYDRLVIELGDKKPSIFKLKAEALMRASSLYSRGLANRQWKIAYRELFRAILYERDVARPLIPSLTTGDSTSSGECTGQHLLRVLQEESSEQFRVEWTSLQRQTKAAMWQRLALWLLENDPVLLLSFLLVTTSCTEKPNFTFVGDCLLYVERFHYEEWQKNGEVSDETYQEVIEACLHPSDWPLLNAPQKATRLYIEKARPNSVNLVFDESLHKLELSGGTVLCFVRRFSELGDIDRALKALNYVRNLKDSRFGMESEGVMRHCCKLLLLDTVEDGPDGRNFQILPKLLQAGVKPDRDMMNIVLTNSAKTKDSQLMNDILKYMIDHGHKLDSYTYLILLQEALAREDRTGIQLLVKEINTEDTLRANPYLASKIFHSHYLFTVKNMDSDSDRSSILFSMLDMYSRLYDIKPLRDLLIVPSHYTPHTNGIEQPPPHVLCIALATHLRCKPDASKTLAIYNRFQKLVSNGDTTIAPMAETDHTYNAFLTALRHYRRELRSCVRIVEDMLHPQSEVDRKGNAIKHAKPSTRTWTLLLSAFIFSRQSAGVEKIREMMSKHDIKYNDVTWNTIISGHANDQNIRATAQSIKEMEQAGYPMDSYTVKPLRFMHDPEALWAAMEALDRQYNVAELEPEEQLDPADEKDLRHKLVDSALEKLANKGKKAKPVVEEVRPEP